MNAAADIPTSMSLVVHASRAKFFGMLLTASVFATIGVFVVFDRTKPANAWVGALNVIVFGSAVVVFARQAFDRRPRVVIDDAGVFDRTLRVGIIPWDQIDGAFIGQVAGHAFVASSLRMPRDSCANVHRSGNVDAREPALGFTPLRINLTGTLADPTPCCGTSSLIVIGGRGTMTGSGAAANMPR